MLAINKKDNLLFTCEELTFRYDYFRDFHQFCSHAEPLEIEGYQLSPGDFEGYVAQIIADEIQLDIAQRNCQMKTRGISPKTWCFGIPFNSYDIVYEKAYNLEDNYIVVNPINNEFSFFQSPFTGWFIINVSHGYLDTSCQGLHLPEPENLIGKGGDYVPVMAAPPEKVKILREVCHRTFQQAFGLERQNEEPSHSVTQSILKDLEELTQLLLLAIAEAKQINPKKVLIKRASILHQAEEFMMTSLKADITTKDICKKVGVSQRTLEYIFKDFYQVSPKNYYKLLRLNSLRQYLQQCSPKVKLSEVATEFGFIHRGQLAADYKCFFGELPSETLKR